MNEHFGDSYERLLVDYHLGQLDPVQTALVKDALSSSPGLAEQSRSISDSLKALDGWAVQSPPADLAESVLAHVAAEGNFAAADQSAASFEASATDASAGPSALGPGFDAELSATPFLSIRELVAIAACVTIFAGVFLPGYYRARQMARRSACADNLGQLAGAVGMYAQSHAGAVPFAGAIPHASWMPVKTPGVLSISNRRHPYLLMKLRLVKNPNVFICPSRERDIPMRAENYEGFSDFAEACNISYAYQNMNGGAIRKAEAVGRLALLSDQNPRFDGGQIRKIAPYQQNSQVHGVRGGQNVAFLDGSVEWATSPHVGIAQDDIFRAGNITRYTGTEIPQSPTDSFLIP